MIGMAAAANIGGILLSSIGESKKDQKKKWKEGAFQMSLTTLPLLLVDGSIKLVEKCKSAKINNNFVKIIVSAFGVAIGSNTAIAISNKLRNDKEAKKPKNEVKNPEFIEGLEIERHLHRQFMKLVEPGKSFEEIYSEMNELIKCCGYENLSKKLKRQ